MEKVEKPFQKGKYTFAREFSKGYFDEIRTIREHYGQKIKINITNSYPHKKKKSHSGRTSIDKFIENQEETCSYKMVFSIFSFFNHKSKSEINHIPFPI